MIHNIFISPKFYTVKMLQYKPSLGENTTVTFAHARGFAEPNRDAASISVAYWFVSHVVFLAFLKRVDGRQCCSRRPSGSKPRASASRSEEVSE